jgi:hypothetical protein
MYYGLFLVPYMVVVCGTLMIACARTRAPVLKGLLVAAAIVAIAVLPVAKAYLGARQVVGERGRQEVVDGSATWQNYLAPAEANAVYGSVFARFMQPERRLFPGFVAMALAVVGLWPYDQPRRRATCLAYVLGLLVAFDVSLGLNGITYTILYDHFLPFRALRIPARMGVIAGFSVAVLAGFGAARLLARVGSARGRVLLAGTLGMLMLVEYASKPLDLMTIPDHSPEIYADIVRDRGDSPPAALFEFPASALDDPTYLYYSTFHWQHLVNGYSGFFPPSYRRLMDALKNFPSDSAFGEMRAHGTRYLVVHGERMIGTRYQRLIPQLDRRADLNLVSRRPWFDGYKHGEISAYRLLY